MWYHEGPPELEEARLWIAKYSVVQAKERLELARQDRSKPTALRAAKRQETHKQLRVRHGVAHTAAVDVITTGCVICS